MSDVDTVREVADRLKIMELIYRYCRSMDRMDHELGYSIWHDDATADYGPEVYQGSGRGFIDFVCEQHRKALVHHHQVTNIIIKLDGDRATSESYYTSPMRFMHGDKQRQVTTWGRYLDQWSRRNGRWGIDKRVTIRDFDQVIDAAPMHQFDRGKRDRTDPSYGFIG